MMSGYRPKIAFVVRTVGLEYDDRIRKECITLSEHSDLTIFAHFYDNREANGVTSYGIPYESVNLFSREVFPSSRFLLIKSLEFYFRLSDKLTAFDLIWAHEEYTFLFALLAKKQKLIWDLHEIPFRFEAGLMKKIFNFIEKKSKKIIHANQYRIDYLIRNEIIRHPEKHVFIRNYPDNVFASSLGDDFSDKDFKKWLSGSKYVYFQGLSVDRRYPINSIEAVLQTPGLKAVVVGGFDQEALAVLKKRYSTILSDRIYFTGMVDQLDIPFYLEPALLSIILYDTKTPNNKYCEPNRLYQSIVLGVPVVVGCNQTMKDVIDTHKCGLALATDGRDVSEIMSAITNLRHNYDYYRSNALKARHDLLWKHNSIDESWYR